MSEYITGIVLGFCIALFNVALWTESPVVSKKECESKLTREISCVKTYIPKENK